MLSIRISGLRTRTIADPDQDHLGGEVGDGEDQVEFRRLLGASDVDHRERGDEDGAADDVARGVAERLPEDGQVVGHEVGRDRDRDRVVEHLPPGGDEADHLVEGVAGEARGAAGLRVHHGRLGVGGGGGGEDQAGDDEGDRGQAEGEGRGDAERVVDRGADVAVGGREQGADAVDAAERFVPGDAAGHLGRPPHVVAGQLVGGGAAAEEQGELELGAEQLEDAAGALLPAGGEAPERRAADEDGVGAERERDRDVDPAADAAVDDDRAAAVDRCDGLLEDVGGGGGAVELAAAVVGDDDPGGAVLDGERRVLPGLDPLDEDRQLALGDDRLEVRPAEGGVDQLEGFGDGDRRGRSRGRR